MKTGYEFQVLNPVSFVRNSAPARLSPVLLRHRADQVILVFSEGKTLLMTF